jgi:F420-0:gamma-glutamyl ligase-like protein
VNQRLVHNTHNTDTKENIMSSKNPFELRFDTLAMAKELLDRTYEMQMTQMFEAIEQAKKQSKDVTEVFEQYTPKMYQPSEIMEKAEELYKFVTKKD